MKRPCTMTNCAGTLHWHPASRIHICDTCWAADNSLPRRDPVQEAIDAAKLARQRTKPCTKLGCNGVMVLEAPAGFPPLWFDELCGTAEAPEPPDQPDTMEEAAEPFCEATGPVGPMHPLTTLEGFSQFASDFNRRLRS